MRWNNVPYGNLKNSEAHFASKKVILNNRSKIIDKNIFPPLDTTKTTCHITLLSISLSW